MSSPSSAATRRALRLDVGERLAPVDLRLALAEQVEVGAVQHIDGRVHAGLSSPAILPERRGAVQSARRARPPWQSRRRRRPHMSESRPSPCAPPTFPPRAKALELSRAVRLAHGAGAIKRPLGDLFGLAKFRRQPDDGCSPAAQSALRHAHTVQDEFVYILEGAPTLVTDAGRTPLAPGMCAGFKGGSGDAHHLVNETDSRRRLSRNGRPRAGRRRDLSRRRFRGAPRSRAAGASPTRTERPTDGDKPLELGLDTFGDVTRDADGASCRRRRCCATSSSRASLADRARRRFHRRRRASPRRFRRLRAGGRCSPPSPRARSASASARR